MIPDTSNGANRLDGHVFIDYRVRTSHGNRESSGKIVFSLSKSGNHIIFYFCPVKAQINNFSTIYFPQISHLNTCQRQALHQSQLTACKSIRKAMVSLWQKVLESQGIHVGKKYGNPGLTYFCWSNGRILLD